MKTDTEKLNWLLAYLNEHADTDYETGQKPNAEMSALAHYEHWVEYGAVKTEKQRFSI